MRIFYRFAFALVATASVPMILGNPVFAAGASANLREGAASVRVQVALNPRAGTTRLLAALDALMSPARR